MEDIVSPATAFVQPASKLRSAAANSIAPAFSAILPMVARTSSARPRFLIVVRTRQPSLRSWSDAVAGDVAGPASDDDQAARGRGR
jgi:hypothetical protein